jgi:voltage-gated potassium channel
MPKPNPDARLPGPLGSIAEMSPARRFVLALAGIVSLTAIGTTGYMLIERMSLIDALYMTVITISTVGFGEVKPLSAAGKLFTMGLIVFGVGNAFYLLAVVAELLIEGRLREYLGVTAMQRKIHELQEHVIICGFGRFGRVVAEELLRHSIPLVVIDPDPAKHEELSRLDALHLLGDATRDEVLEQAGIAQARAIVVATSSDADNVYITLSAREKNRSLMIHARGESEGGMRRLKLAGADQVISAYQRGGMRVAATILRPSVVDFLELAAPGRGTEVDLEQLRIDPASPLVGRSIGALEKETKKLRIVALKRNNEPISLIPEPDTLIHASDYLVVIGDRASLKALVETIGK